MKNSSKMKIKEREKEENRMKKFMKNRSIKSFSTWSNQQVSIYTQARLHHLIKKYPRAKAYRFDNLKKMILNNFRFTAGLQFMRYKATITRIMNTFTKEHFTKNPTTSKSADVFEWNVITEAANKLREEGWKGIMAALVLLFCHTTGCRAAEALALHWEDFKAEENESGKYWTWKLRTSKNNMDGKRNEQLTYKRHPSKKIFEDTYRIYRKTLGKPKTGIKVSS